MSRRRIQVFDTTLRDGEQSPGIALQPHEKAEIAEQLERLGVDVIEAGFAGASPGDFEGVRAVEVVAVDDGSVTAPGQVVEVPIKRDVLDLELVPGQKIALSGEKPGLDKREHGALNGASGGEDIGRLYIARWPSQHCIIDIALLPEHRSKGLGEALLRDLIDEAAAVGKTVMIYVEKFNPAMRLYCRLGFEAEEDKGVYDLMRWTAASS